MGDKEVINITLVSAADVLQLKESDRLNKGEKREGISCSFSLGNTGSRKWSEKKFGIGEGKSEIKAIMMRNTVSVSDGGIKRRKSMGQWEKGMVLVHAEEMREQNKWIEMCPRQGKVFCCLRSFLVLYDHLAVDLLCSA